MYSRLWPLADQAGTVAPLASSLRTDRVAGSSTQSWWALYQAVTACCGKAGDARDGARTKASQVPSGVHAGSRVTVEGGDGTAAHVAVAGPQTLMRLFCQMTRPPPEPGVSLTSASHPVAATATWSRVLPDRVFPSSRGWAPGAGIT